ncbi:hypothetical protein ACHHV8_02525 [Paenibacillus sp. TAB 01]|uniref:hypothetical protein n=1 Tax=Paenibacillus sp. TAB 01 TaxID=3368988 RepID=UPI003751ED9C
MRRPLNKKKLEFRNSNIEVLYVSELIKYRHTLYEKFENINSKYDFWELQKELVNAIIKTEEELNKGGDEKDEWIYHLDRLYSIGDAIVWSVLESFTIRQLGKFESGKTSLLAQKEVIFEIINKFDREAKEKAFILADITRCITTGDVIEVQSSDKIHIIECKTSTPDKIDDILRGRIGRQFSKNFWLQDYLERGFGKFFKADLITRTHEVDVSGYQDHFHLLPEIIEKCTANDPGSSAVLAEPGLVYIASRYDCEDGIDPEYIKNKLWDFKKPYIKGISSLIEEPRDTIFHKPPLAFPIPLKYKKLLNELDVIILCILDEALLKDKFLSRGYEYTSTDEGLPRLGKNGVVFEFHVRFINEIMQSFESIDKIITQMISLYDSTSEGLSDSEQKYIQERPKSLKDFVEYLDEYYELTLETNESPGVISIGDKKLIRKRGK